MEMRVESQYRLESLDKEVQVTFTVNEDVLVTSIMIEQSLGIKPDSKEAETFLNFLHTIANTINSLVK